MLKYRHTFVSFMQANQTSKSKNIIHGIIQQILFGGHLQALGAIGIFVFSSTIFSQQIIVRDLVLIYASFYFVYLYNYYRERDLDKITNSQRSQIITSREKLIPYLLSFIAISVLVYLIAIQNILLFAFFAIILAFGVLYTEKIKGLTKYIPLLKNIYVSLVFAFLVLYPPLVKSEPSLILVLILCFFIFYRSMIMQIFLDIKDIESDKLQSLKTLGVLVGRKKALNTILFLSFSLAPILLVADIFFTSIPIALPIVAGLLFFIDIFAIYILKKKTINAMIIKAAEFIYLPIILYGIIPFIR